MHIATPAILAIIATSVSAYSPKGRTFAVNHFYGKGPLMMGRVDPIVNPGGPSGHVHAIQGGNAFGVTMTDRQALDQSTCTSSRVKNDKSNYWTPSLYFQDPITKQLEAVEMFYMNVYYFFEATTDKIMAFQPGHRMVIGNTFKRTPPTTNGKLVLDLSNGTPQPVQFTCPRSNTNVPLYPPNSDGMHGVGIGDPVNKGAGVGFPDQNCDGFASPLRADIHFPSCYNPAAGLDNYKTNMEFPTHGNCPQGWIHTPHLFYEVYWNTPKFAKRWTPGQGKQPFVLANGDPTGYSLHGDFLSGWDVDTLQQIIDNCNAGDAGMDKCPGLMGGLNDPSTSCNIPDPINEVISGVLGALPGKNPITGWGVDVSPPSGGSGTTASMGPAPSPSATKIIQSSSAGGPKQSATTAKPTSSVVKVVETQAPSPTATQMETTPANPVHTEQTTLTTKVATTATEDNTIFTSYVSETTVIWTTVTATGPAPTSVGSSSSTAGWSYTGCFRDSKDRILTGITFANVGQHAVTNTKCIAYCNNRGYSMAGTEYGGQCFCGNKLNTKTPINETSCNMPCEGDESQTCGGGMAISVYSTTSKHTKRTNRHLHRHLNRDASH